MNAVNWARQQPGVSVVSMSWGGAESSGDHAYDSIFTTPAGHTGITFVASSGDNGAWTDSQRTRVGVSWPACDPTVLSIGGTTLYTTSNGGYLGESAWSGSGGGYSHVYAEPWYQRGVQNTGVRTVPDVAYNADPNSGVWIYNTYGGGWQVGAGTSAGAPQWAGLIALADQGRSLIGLGPLDGASQTLPALYELGRDFRDVAGGSNGFSATRGYDLATGLGTPYAVNLVGDLAFHVPGNFSAGRMALTNAMTLADATSGQSRVASSLLAIAPADSTPATSPGIPTTKTLVPATNRVAYPSMARAAVNQAEARRFGIHDDALSSLFDDYEIC
jgi:subtilase family serine protease